MEDSTIHDTPPPPWSVLEFTFSDRNTDSELIIMCNKKCFVMHSAAANFSDSPQLKERYRFFLEVARNFELDGYTVEDFYDWAVEPLLPVFRDLPSIQEGHSFLDEYLFPETLVYTLRADSGELVAAPLESTPRRETRSRFGVVLPDETCTAWPCFRPFEVRICPQCPPAIGPPPSQTPNKVSLRDGTVAFIKLFCRGDKNNLIRELDSYTKIKAAPLDDTLPISRLRGLVRDGSGSVYGLLLTYIDCRRVTLAGAAPKPDTPTCQREKWAAQIQDTVYQLHSAGIVWGDAKPDNVLIDRNQDAWVVDFGGGYTDGWVPKELTGTVEGDLVALRKMMAFIGVRRSSEGTSR
ncbi:Serine/threonine-protein kinase PKH1 [Tolypocladium paradoxum]|uniref:Serine/threonine-protein kinase PKH1 n=1 Tax=Tolypocladium paradoxum TaxID=94208 RepID=A0A2S4KSB4_9HYPO|nr:Serine/threonine-protein kinase PKH1 [Tolypocladium paradoxum]